LTVVVVFPGRPGAFAEDAALWLAPPGARLSSVRTVAEAFAEIAAGRAARAVVAVENSLGGSVGATVDALMTEPVAILAEQQLRIVHVLAGVPGATLSEVRRVRSHPIALAQCRDFFARHPEIAAVPATDTASAIAEVVREGAKSEAAIGSRRAAEMHGAHALATDVQDAGDNRTRFLLVGPGEAGASADPEACKATVVLALPHRPGALAGALSEIASCDVDVTRIDARPSRQVAFEYLFQLDLVDAGGRTVDAVQRLRSRCRWLRELGRYAVRADDAAPAGTPDAPRRGRPAAS
jgi:prephenate dehydratase